jgi:hypothetical protein
VQAQLLFLLAQLWCSAVLTLEKAGILRQNAKNRKSGIYVADDIMQAFNIYERSLAILSGDAASGFASA